MAETSPAAADGPGRPEPLDAGAAGYVGGNRVGLLQGGDELFPAMQRAMAAARVQVWVASYIFHDDEAGQAMAQSLCATARRGVAVHLVVDGFGSLDALPRLREWLAADGVHLDVFRPLDRWSAWLQPAQLRRMHHKLCVVDEEVAFVGGINIVDDRIDLTTGAPSSRAWTSRSSCAARWCGRCSAWHRPWARVPAWGTNGAARSVRWRAAAARWPTRCSCCANCAAARRPTRRPATSQAPVRVAFVVRDNFGRRRAIERSYIEAVRAAQLSVDIACPYFYPRRAFRRSLLAAAQRGVRVRLLMQGKVDYRLAALAARVLYDELLSHGVRIFEYTPAFLHAKVAVVDDGWATVGSSNIDPLSLLLNLEANAVVQDEAFARLLRQRLDLAMRASHEVKAPLLRQGWRRWLSRGFVAWCANVYLRVAGITGRY